MRTHRNKVMIILALGLALLPLFARSAQAAKIQTNGRPVAGAIAYADTYGTYLVVWAEDRNTGTGQDIYAARVTASGIVQGNEVPLVVAPGNQSDPTVAFSRRVGQFLVIYTNDAGDNGGLPNPGATPIPGLPTPPVPLAAGQSMVGPDLAPVAASASVPTSGDALVTLNEDRAVGDAVASDASADSGIDAAVPQQPPTATPVAPPAAGSHDLWGVWASSSGYRIANHFALVNSPADETYPDLTNSAFSGGDQFILVWREVTGADVSINVQKYVGGFGYYLIINGPKRIVATGGDKGKPTIATEESKQEYLVAWSETSKTNPSRDIISRQMNANATPYGQVRTLVSGLGDDLNPSLASLGAFGGYILGWEYHDGAAAPDIRVLQLNRSGVPYGSSTFVLAGGPNYSFLPDLASSSRSTTLAIWLDRNAASDHSLIAREINRNGRPLAPERIVVQGGTGPDAGATPALPPIATVPALPTP